MLALASRAFWSSKSAFCCIFRAPARLLRLWTAMPAPVWLSGVWRCGDGIAVGKPPPALAVLRVSKDLGRRLTELPRRRARLLHRKFQIGVGSAVSPGTLVRPGGSKSAAREEEMVIGKNAEKIRRPGLPSFRAKTEYAWQIQQWNRGSPVVPRDAANVPRPESS